MEVLSDIFRGQSWVTYFEIVTAVIGITQLKKFKTFTLKLFIIFFVYMALNDFFSRFYGRTIGGGYNSLLANISYVTSFTVLLYIFQTHIKNKQIKLFIRLLLASYVLLVLLDLLVFKVNYHRTLQVWPYIIGGVTVLISVLYYFYEVFNSDQIVKLEKDPIFWIGVGYFFYYLAKIPLSVGTNFYATNSDYQYLFKLNNIMTIVLCTSLLIAFLWSHQKE